MFQRYARNCSFAVIVACFLVGCFKEAPQNRAANPKVSASPSASRDQSHIQTGEELFKQFCNNCHPDGGNVSDPKRTLHRSVLRKDRITTPEDIVKIMRNPIARMIRFDAATISDKEALAIAEYVLKTLQ
jgi:cytochrome c6